MGIYDPILSAYQHGADQNLALQRTPNYADQILQRLQQGERAAEESKINQARLEQMKGAADSELLNRQIRAMEAAANYGTDENQPAMQEMLSRAGFSGNIQPGMGAKALHEKNLMDMLKLKLESQERRDANRNKTSQLVAQIRSLGLDKPGSEVGKILWDYEKAMGTPREWGYELLKQTIGDAIYRSNNMAPELAKQGVLVSPKADTSYRGQIFEQGPLAPKAQIPGQTEPEYPMNGDPGGGEYGFLNDAMPTKPVQTGAQKLMSRLPSAQKRLSTPTQAQVQKPVTLSPKGERDVAAVKIKFQGASDEYKKGLSAIEEVVNHPGFSSIGGIDPRRLAPGTDAHTAWSLIEQILNKGFLNAIIDLKSSGGTLGAVSNAEGEKLKSSYSAIKPTLNNKDLRRELVKLSNQIKSSMKRIEAAANESLSFSGRSVEGEKPRKITDKNGREVKKSGDKYVYVDDGSEYRW